MWPFTQKSNLPTVEQGEEGQATLVLTEEEQAEIRNFFATFGKPEGAGSDESWYMHPAAYRALTAWALIGYAQDQVMFCEIADEDVVDRNTCLRKALEAARKAYCVHPLPIYMFDMGCLLEMLGDVSSADNAFRSFLESQQMFQPTSMDEIALKNRDVNAAIAEAQERLTTRAPRLPNCNP